MLKTLVMTLALLGAGAHAAQSDETQHETTIADAADTPQHDCACLRDQTCEETETMIPVDQTRLHDPARGVPGNCMQAAIATLLDLTLDDVPDFTAGEMVTDARLKAYWQRVDDFLAARGLYRIGLPEQGLPGLHLAAGLSSRGVMHVVVRNGWQTVHDPHPSRADLASVDRLWVLVPINPARVRLPDVDEAVSECVGPQRVRDIAIVRGAEEWTGVYVDGTLCYQSDSPDLERLLTTDLAGEAVRLSRWVTVRQDWLDLAELPHDLADIPASAIVTT